MQVHLPCMTCNSVAQDLEGGWHSLQIGFWDQEERVPNFARQSSYVAAGFEKRDDHMSYVVSANRVLEASFGLPHSRIRIPMHPGGCPQVH